MVLQVLFIHTTDLPSLRQSLRDICLKEVSPPVSAESIIRLEMARLRERFEPSAQPSTNIIFWNLYEISKKNVFKIVSQIVKRFKIVSQNRERTHFFWGEIRKNVLKLLWKIFLQKLGNLSISVFMRLSRLRCLASFISHRLRWVHHAWRAWWGHLFSLFFFL